MRNTLILSHFFDFLNEQGLFAAYFKEAMSYGERSPFLLQTLFFKFKPDTWITGAFSWDQDPSHDWCTINGLWLSRVNILKSEYPFSN